MQSREWHDQIPDKESWGPGPWQTEPDKAQWYDAPSRLPCLAVRSPVTGSWCGYVGLPPGHRVRRFTFQSAHRLSPAVVEQLKAEKLAEAQAKAAQTEDPLHQRLIIGAAEFYQPNRKPNGYDQIGNYVSVHGGLTFCDDCQDPTPGDWHRMREQIAYHQNQAARYPVGDSARWLREWLAYLDDFETFRERASSTGICHAREPGDPHPVRWLGFDCAHAGDFCPAMAAFMKRLPKHPLQREIEREITDLKDHGLGEFGEVYRDLDYIKSECASLARQLNGLGARRTWKALW